MEPSQEIMVGVMPGFRGDHFELGPVAKAVAPAVGLFELPQHLMKKWSAVMDAMVQPAGSTEVASGKFTEFARSVIEFMRFKNLPVPAECRCDLLQITPAATWLEAKPQDGHGAGSPQFIINLGPEISMMSFAAVSAEEAGEAQSSSEEAEKGAAPSSLPVRLKPGQGHVLQSSGLFHSECRSAGESTILLAIAAN